MSLRSDLRNLASPLLKKHPRFRSALLGTDKKLDLLRHSAAEAAPFLIKADTQTIFLTLTSSCNLRCVGCNYGRSFMPGTRLPLQIVKDLLDDAKAMGVWNVRLYGGEPLLHPDIVEIAEHSIKLGLKTWLTTNGILLKKKIDALYDVGIRDIGIGFYGVDDHYNSYVQRSNSFGVMEDGVRYVREKYGDEIKIHLGWVLMRPTCNLEAVDAVWDFAIRYNTPIAVNLVHYSLPYFNEGPEGELQFETEHRPEIETLVAELVRRKIEYPEMISQSTLALRSIPDWLIKKAEMRVPCNKYRLIWVGSDGSVQLCYVTFPLGTLHEKRLSELLYTPEHHQAARDCFKLNCPNCHCGFDGRVETHAPSRKLYGD